MNKLRKKFITLNLLIVGSIAIVSALVIYSSSSSQMSIMRLISLIIIILCLVLIGSLLSSKISMKPIQASWRRQINFTADASHELRTPLAVIQTNLELVMNNPGETVGNQIKWLTNIHIETIRMTKLVDDLLTLSRYDAGAVMLEYSLFSLNSVADEVAALFEATANQKNIDIQVAAYCEVRFWADNSRIKQLLSVLVDNAVKYMGRPGSIQIELSKKDNTVQIIVLDTGKGIAPEHLPRIFDRFYRAENQAEDGCGLGLSIAEWIAKAHGGSIRAESVIMEGIRFIACFPLQSAKANAAHGM